MDAQKMIDRLMDFGVAENKAQTIVQIAIEQKWSIQKTYFLTEARILKVDIIVALLMVFFIGYLAVNDIQSALAAVFIFGLLFIVMEIACRFHKGYFKKIATFLKLKGL
jgi:small-conductance mechanosensitive channel